ncbi:unnamed protein product, partial [Tetraodon nigroviridis]
MGKKERRSPPQNLSRPRDRKPCRKKKVRALNVVIVEGLTQSHFYKHYLSLPHLTSRYTTVHVASAIFSSQLSGSDFLFRHQTHPLDKGLPGLEEFVCTDSADHATDSSPLFGLDCEMCWTEKGLELARVSLVDSDGRCLLDELVKPQNHILDYLTCFSGITAAMLSPVTTTLRDVQVQLRSLLPSDAVLVGHSLNNDLKALKLIHRHVLDTSLLYRGQCGQRFKLKVLAQVVLKRKIQTDDRKGHDPTEDALAALELAQYFIQMGPRRVI